MSLKRREVVLNHLRIGHTYYTHAYLIKKRAYKNLSNMQIPNLDQTQNVETRKRIKNTTYLSTFTTHWGPTKNPSKNTLVFMNNIKFYNLI